MNGVDTRVYDVAEVFVNDTVQGYQVDPARLAAFYQRAAEEMQQAIEDACAEIERELIGGAQ